MFDHAPNTIPAAFAAFVAAHDVAVDSEDESIFERMFSEWHALMAMPCQCVDDLSLKAKAVLALRDQDAPWTTDTFNDDEMPVLRSFFLDVALWASRSITAVHEAGHAVVAARLFGPEQVLEVALRGSVDLEEAASGAVVVNHTEDDTEMDKAIFAAAGFAAACAHGVSEDRSRIGCDDDMQRAGDLWDAGCSAASAIVQSPENFQAVRIMAGLLERDGAVGAQVLSVLIDYVDGQISAEDWYDFLTLSKVQPLRT